MQDSTYDWTKLGEQVKVEYTSFHAEFIFSAETVLIVPKSLKKYGAGIDKVN